MLAKPHIHHDRVGGACVVNLSAEIVLCACEGPVVACHHAVQDSVLLESLLGYGDLSGGHGVPGFPGEADRPGPQRHWTQCSAVEVFHGGPASVRPRWTGDGDHGDDGAQWQAKEPSERHPLPRDCWLNPGRLRPPRRAGSGLIRLAQIPGGFRVDG